jgi:5-methyltetrahydropteroyltriglutamate--homocysteine methyltransferase
MMRTKPPFRADHVGSLLRPPVLKEARTRREQGRLSAAELKTIEDREIGRIIRKQEEVGLQSATDGEFRRAFWHLDFIEGLDGVEPASIQAEGVRFKDVKPRWVNISGRVGYSHHPMIEHFRFVQAHTLRTAKMTIPSPSAIHYREGRKSISAQAYPSLEPFFHDVGQAWRKAVRAFADAGCRYLQLDEVYLALLCDPEQHKILRARGDDPDRLPAIYADMINTAISDIPADMTITMHLCRGNFKSTFLASGGYEPVANLLFNTLNIHGYFMEYDTERAGSFEPLRFVPKDKIVVLGLVTTKSGELESKDELKHRIDQASKFVDIDRLCLSGQCGFASTEEGNVLREDEQWAKLRMIVEVAEEVWG